MAEARLEYKDLAFEKINKSVRVKFKRIFYFDIPNEDLNHISEFSIERNAIIFRNTSQQKADNKFNHLINIGFAKLKNKLTGNDAVYIHSNSGIPLIGTNYFGLVDRGTNIIEIKPINSCNLSCIYCSVDQQRRDVDFIVEKDYLVEGFRKIAEFKDSDKIEAHIGGQGEPLLYSDIIGLVSGISKIKGVKTISIDTNGVMLSKSMVDELVEAGLTRFNLSINAIEPELAGKISGTEYYDIGRIKKIAEYIAEKADMIIAPVMIMGINIDEMPKIIRFAKKIRENHNVWVGIQNYLQYRFGRKAGKEIKWDDFYELLHKWEKDYDICLTKMPFEFIELPKIKPPFRKDDVIKADIVCRGRFRNEMIAAAQGRAIAVPNCIKNKGRAIIKIFRSKDNIFSGKIVGRQVIRHAGKNTRKKSGKHINRKERN